jgi:hypothetical protein
MLLRHMLPLAQWSLLCKSGCEMRRTSQYSTMILPPMPSPARKTTAAPNPPVDVGLVVGAGRQRAIMTARRSAVRGIMQRQLL